MRCQNTQNTVPLKISYGSRLYIWTRLLFGFTITVFSKFIHSLRSTLHACHSSRSLRPSNTNLLSAPFVRTSFGARSFSVAAPKIWNSLPPSLRTCTSPDTFRRHPKTHYCQQAFQST